MGDGNAGQGRAAGARFAALDAMRGVCALLVMGMHGSFLAVYDPFPSAYVVVDLFFMMSGFVIGHAYDAKLAGGGYAGMFMARRFARLAPMWTIGLLIGAALPFVWGARHTGLAEPIAVLALALGFIPWPAAGYLFPFNSPGWSLFFEMAANLFYAAFARRLTVRVLVAIVLVSAAALAIGAQMAGDLNAGGEWRTAPLGLARVGFGFFLGLLAYRLPRPRRRFGGAPFALAMLMLALLLHLAPGAALRPTFDTALILLICPALLWLGLATDLRGTRLAETLGLISYPLYAIHFAILQLLYALRGKATGWQSVTYPPSIVAAVLIGIVALAWVLGRWVDPAAQRWAARRLHQRAVRLPAPEAAAR